jgi:hypothetical protein
MHIQNPLSRQHRSSRTSLLVRVALELATANGCF